MPIAFQPNAFQNPVTGDHEGFQVGQTFQSDVTRLSIDQSTQLVCDMWELELKSSDFYRARAQADGVNLRTGLLTPSGSSLVQQITDGKVLEWDLNITPNRITGQMRRSRAFVP